MAGGSQHSTRGTKHFKKDTPEALDDRENERTKTLKKRDQPSTILLFTAIHWHQHNRLKNRFPPLFLRYGLFQKALSAINLPYFDLLYFPPVSVPHSPSFLETALKKNFSCLAVNLVMVPKLRVHPHLNSVASRFHIVYSFLAHCLDFMTFPLQNKSTGPSTTP